MGSLALTPLRGRVSVKFGLGYRCPKFDGDAKQTLEIRVERKTNWKLGQLGELSFGMLKLGQLGDESFGILKLGELGEVSFAMLKLGELGEVSLIIYKLCELVR